MRIAVLSSPRSGNTWLRYLLAGLYGLQHQAVHHPGELEWDGLPEGYVLQLHWHPTDELRRLLDAGGFRVVTICRHPLDLLLSILHFCAHEPETRHWLEGEGGDERGIHGQGPTSAAFREYAVSARAKALLAVTPAWLDHPDVTRVRYEDLVRDPVGTLRTVATTLGPFRGDPTSTVASLTIERLRPTSGNSHYWQGRPGLWKTLLPQSLAETIVEAHAPTFAALEYAADSAEWPSARVAAERWHQIA
jgi:hypothetical protein